MIGALVEYTGAFSDFHGKRGIVISVCESVMYKGEPACKIAWTEPIHFGGRIVSKSTFVAQELKVISEVSDNESK